MQPQPEPQPVGRVTRAEEALPLAADAQPFSYADAVALLKGSAASHIAGYISVAAAIATLTLNLQLLDHGEEDTSSDTREARVFNVACGANRGFGCSSVGTPIPYARSSRFRIGAMTSTDEITPSPCINCCFHGVAPRINPAFRSCMLSPAIAAALATTAPIMMAAAGPIAAPPVIHNSNSEANSIVAIVTPEIELFDEPTSPAM